MKTIKFTAYLFYKYYSTGGTKSIPYFSTLCALAMIVILHVFQILVIFNGMDLLPATSAKPGTERLIKYFETAIFLSPLFLFLSLIIKKKELQSMHYEEKKLKKGNLFLIIYIILSMALLIFLILLKKNKI